MMEDGSLRLDRDRGYPERVSGDKFERVGG